MLAFKGDSIGLTYPATIAVIGKRNFLKKLIFIHLFFKFPPRFDKTNI